MLDSQQKLMCLLDSEALVDAGFRGACASADSDAPSDADSDADVLADSEAPAFRLRVICYAIQRRCYTTRHLLMLILMRLCC